MISNSQPWSYNTGSQPRSAIPTKHGVQLEPASSIHPAAIQWVWNGWLAKGKIHILAGPAGTGKTTIAIHMAATISSGGFGSQCWPDKSPAPSGNVIIWTGEDGIEDTIVPRLMASGADMNRVYIIRSTVTHGRSRPFDFATDIVQLSDAIANVGQVALIIIDSIVQAVAGDSNKNADVRRGLAPLVALGEQHNCGILGITHVNKGSKGKEPLDRVNGSLAYSAVARVVMLTVKVQSDPSDDGPANCVLVRAKSNIGPDDGGFEYQIQPVELQSGMSTLHTSTIRWNETPLQGSAKDILKFSEESNAIEKISAVDAAENFLKAILANGGLPFPEIETKAREEKIAMAAIKRAKGTLGIKSQKQRGVGQASPHFWYLPEEPNNQINPTGFNHLARPSAQPYPVNPFAHQRSYESQAQPHQLTPAQSLWETTSVEPVAPVEPVEPVASVEPGNATLGTDTAPAENILQCCIDECLNRYKSCLLNENSVEEEDIENIVAEVLDFYFRSDTHNIEFRNTLREILWTKKSQCSI